MARKNGKPRASAVKPTVKAKTLPKKDVFPTTLRLIKKTAGICGGKARVSGTRIPVWGLENARRIGLSAKQILNRYPSLSERRLKAAWKYAEAHKAEIDRQIQDSQGC